MAEVIIMRRIIFIAISVMCLASLVLAQLSEFEIWQAPIEIEGFTGGRPLIISNECLTRENVRIAEMHWLRLASVPANNEWAGDYSFGSEGEGTYERVVRWDTATGFVALGIATCYPMLMEARWGQVTFSMNSLVFQPAAEVVAQSVAPVSSSSCRPFLRFLADKFVPVKWGQAHYLVPERQLAAFCQDYVAGLGVYSDPKNEPFVLPLVKREELGRKLEQGLPVLPERYGHLVRVPIEAQITAIVRRTLKPEKPDSLAELNLLVRLNAGRLQGVRRGMVFKAYYGDRWDSIEIAWIGERTALGTVTRIGDEIQDLPAVKVGMQFSTASFPR